ncbi:MAG: ABC transporter ATP-binding protein [Alphaproteobacteria bacterium GM7ARS4]|nr:ABC transporter ATP-binding protein [Alphaproteobacteria bacterium GM7ARS4]
MSYERALEIQDICHRYHRSGAHRDVLSRVSLSVGCGEIGCLLGPSGCGKSTLLRIIAGFEMPLEGCVSLNGRVLTDVGVGGYGACYRMPPEERHVGMVFQDYALFPHLNVYDNICFGVRRMARSERLWLDKAARHLGVEEFLYAWPHTLSGGQQQRVALLRALVRKPRLLLLDEPFSGLDADNRMRVREATLALLKEEGLTALMVTHDSEEAMFMADHIFVMRDGAIVQSGTPFETWLGPVDAFVAELFGPVNRFCGRVDKGVVRIALGSFAAPPSIEEGMEVDILVRPDGIGISVIDGKGGHDDTNVQGHVTSARLLGRFSHITLSLDDGKEIHVHIAGVILPKKGTRVAVLVERCSAFVFPCEGHGDTCGLTRHPNGVLAIPQEGAASSQATPFSLKKGRNSSC